jgi:hypothetical protein
VVDHVDLIGDWQLVQHMLSVEAFDNLDMLLHSGAFASILGFVKSSTRLGALWVASPVPKLTAIPALRLCFFFST